MIDKLSILRIERREWLPTPVFLPGEFHGQSSLVGYNRWITESDMTEQLSTYMHAHAHTHTHTHTHTEAIKSLFHLNPIPRKKVFLYGKEKNHLKK